MKPRIVFWVSFPLLLILDQFTKCWAERDLQFQESIRVIPGFFNLTYVRNTGVAFGLFQGRNGWLIFVAALVLALVVYLARQLEWRQLDINLIAAGFVAGALGNLTDRLRHGYVTDFADFHVAGYHWPAFNVADSCICLAVGWMVLKGFWPFSAAARR